MRHQNGDLLLQEKSEGSKLRFLGVCINTREILLLNNIQKVKFDFMDPPIRNPSQEEVLQAHSVKSLSQHPDNCFLQDFTNEQVQYLNTILPTAYSLQPNADPAPRRNVKAPQNRASRQKVPSRRWGNEPIDQAELVYYAEDPEPAEVIKAPKRAPVKQPKKTKSMLEIEQVENSIYAKYNNSVLQMELNRKSLYEGLDESLKPCVKVLNLLKNSKTSWPFREPVDPIAMGISHYNDIVKEPMDLSKVEHNLKTNVYVTPTQFHADITKIIQNSYLFNQSNIEYSRITSEFEHYYKKIIGENDTQSQNVFMRMPQMEPTKSKASVPSETKKRDSHKVSAPKMSKKKTQNYHSQNMDNQPVTLAEKKELSMNIRKLPREYMKGVVEIVYEGQTQIKGEFDLEDLPNKKIRILQGFVRSKLNGNDGGAGFLERKPTTSIADRQPDRESQFQIDSDDDS